MWLLFNILLNDGLLPKDFEVAFFVGITFPFSLNRKESSPRKKEILMEEMQQLNINVPMETLQNLLATEEA